MYRPKVLFTGTEENVKNQLSKTDLGKLMYKNETNKVKHPSEKFGRTISHSLVLTYTKMRDILRKLV